MPPGPSRWRKRWGVLGEDVEYRQLQFVEAVCRYGGFSGAARYLGISQPTLSKNIARLEDRLGVSLFDRQDGAARPTTCGEFVAARASALVRQFEAPDKDFQQFKDGEAGGLTIGMGPAPRHRLLTPIASRLAAGFPTLNLRTGVASADAISRGEYDVGFVYSVGAEALGDLVRVKLFDDRFAGFVRPGHPALGQGPLSPSDLMKYKLAISALVPGFQEWLGPIDGAQLCSFKGLITDAYDVTAERLANSDFVSIAPRFIFRDKVDAGAGYVHSRLCWRSLPSYAIRDGKWKLLVNTSPTGERLDGMEDLRLGGRLRGSSTPPSTACRFGRSTSSDGSRPAPSRPGRRVRLGAVMRRPGVLHECVRPGSAPSTRTGPSPHRERRCRRSRAICERPALAGRSLRRTLPPSADAQVVRRRQDFRRRDT